MQLYTDNDLIDAFDELNSLAYQLEKAVQEYSRCFFNLGRIKLHESMFLETVPEEKKNMLKEKIKKLEAEIQVLYEEFLECTEEISKKLKNCEILDFDTINDLNKVHYEIMIHYENVLNEYHSLQKLHADENFVIPNLSLMEHQKMKLNIAIKKCNEQLLGNSNVKLLDVYEQEKEVRQFFLRIYGGI